MEVDLADRGGIIRFFNIDDFAKWLAEEDGKWRWLDSALSSDGNIQQVAVRQFQFLGEMSQRISLLRNHAKQTAVLKDLFKETEHLFRKAYQQHKTCLHSRTAEAEFLLSIKESDPVRAAWVLGWFISVPVNLKHQPTLRGAMEGFSFEMGLKDTSEGERLALIALRNEWNEEAARSREALAQLREETAEFRERLAVEVEETNQQKERLASEYNKVIHQEISAAQDQVKTYKTYLKAELTLQEPVKYWRDQKRKHLAFAAVFGVAALITLIFGVISVKSLLVALPEVAQPEKGLLVAPATTQLAIIALTGLAFVWVTRLFVRMMLSHFHLGTDAGEREIMTLVFLSLLQQGNAVAETDRAYILQSLFRPSSTGIIKDDAIPPNIYDLLARIGPRT